jgi:hypothetical protein
MSASLAEKKSALGGVPAHYGPLHSARQSNKNESMPKDLETETKPEVPPPRLPGELYSTHCQPFKQNWGDNHKIVSLQGASSVVKTGEKNL